MAVLLTQTNQSDQEMREYPLVPIRHGVIYPHTESIIQFGREKSIAGVQSAFEKDRRIVFVTQKDANKADPVADDLYTIGTLCEIERTLKTNGEMNAFVRGISRVRIEKIRVEGAFMLATVTEIPEIIEDGSEIEALTKSVVGEFKKAVNLGKAVDIMNFMKLMSGLDAAQLADQVASTLEAKTQEKQMVLETIPVKDRLRLVLQLLTHEIKVLEIERNIASKTQKKFDKNMRDTVLRERLKTIQRELGEDTDDELELEQLRRQLKKAKLPEQVMDKAGKELARLSRMNPHNPETSYIRTWLETLVELPWTSKKTKPVSLDNAQKILDNDHYGLDEVKERIVEYLAVLKLRSEKSSASKAASTKPARVFHAAMPTILCFVGAPGVGKTSLGKSIASALGREFVKVSLGGMRDEAEIRGHRRTYVGAMPGRIIQGMRTAGTKNPVFMLDEIDKVGSDFRGDPSSALLEVLDPEQNGEFSDHYLEVPYDLSEVIFITTANTLDTIPAALRDRLEIIQFSGYTIYEKEAIARKHLIKKLIERNGLDPKKCNITDEALAVVVRRYTREAGVRSLERELSKIMRKMAKKFASSDARKQEVTQKNIQDYLGPYTYAETQAELEDTIGMATGMAWTQVGGDILFVEVALMPGKGKLMLTGQLGDVMKESAEAAFSYIRSRHQALGLPSDFYKELDIHIHVPEGAIPKDGPSAGVTMTTAIVSALTKIPARKDVAMTGEVTLRGRVLEIGGVREKVIAAHRAGITKIILPKGNQKDLVKIPAEIKKELEFHYAGHMDEVLAVSLVKPISSMAPTVIA